MEKSLIEPNPVDTLFVTDHWRYTRKVENMGSFIEITLSVEMESQKCHPIILHHIRKLPK